MCLNGCSWFSFQLLGLSVRLKNPLNPVCVWHCVLDCEQRLFVLISLEHPDIFLMNCFPTLSQFFDLLSWTLWLLNTCAELWASKLDTVFHIPFSISTLKDCVHSFSRTSYPNACSTENPLVSPRVLCRFSGALASVVSACWSLCWLCWFPEQSNPPCTAGSVSSSFSHFSNLILSANFVSNDFLFSCISGIKHKEE